MREHTSGTRRRRLEHPRGRGSGWKGGSLVVSLVALAAPLHAQEEPTLRPDDPSLDGRDLSPFVAVFEVSDSSAEGVESRGYWKSHLQEATVAGEAAFRHTWSLYFPTPTIYDQGHFTARGFRPLLAQVMSPRGHDLLEFASPDTVFQTYVPLGGAPPETSRLVLDGPRFAGAGPFAVATLPLETGKRYRFRSVATDPPTPGTPLVWQAHVVAQEQVVTPAGTTYQAWRVEHSFAADGGEGDVPAVPGVVWIVPRVPYVVRRQYGDRIWALTRFETTERLP